MRGTTRTVVVVAAAGILLGLPAGPAQTGADSAEVTFYGHVFSTGVGAPMPANTEAPIGEDNFGRGSFDWCTDVAYASLGGGVTPGSCDDDPSNKLVLFSTAGFVDVSSLDEFAGRGGYALLHNERGQTKDIVLDPGRVVKARIWLTLDMHSWAVGGGETACIYPHPPDVPCVYPYWGWDPGVQKDFVVKASLYSARLGEHAANASDAPPIGEVLADGSAVLIAEGRVGPMDVVNGIPGYDNVYAYDVDLGKPLVPVIPREHDFFVVYSFNSETGGNGYGIHSWRVWSGEFFPPIFSMPVLNPIDVERVIPTFAHGKLAVLGVLNTPWGSYDVAPDGVEITFEDEAGRVVEPRSIERFGKFSVGHGGHYLPINFTWVWNHNADRLPPGTYTVTVRAANFQHSAQAECSATFTVLPPEGRGQLPRPGPVEEGVCGAQSASEEHVGRLQRDAAGGQGDDRGAPRLPVPDAPRERDPL